MPDRPLLELRAIDAYYGDFQALFGVWLQIDAGQVVAVIGANGAGKSTLLKSIAGLMHPRRGDMLFDGAPIGAPSNSMSPRRGCIRPAMLFNSVLLPAPLAPITATTCPASICSHTPNSAWKSP